MYYSCALNKRACILAVRDQFLSVLQYCLILDIRSTYSATAVILEENDMMVMCPGAR